MHIFPGSLEWDGRTLRAAVHKGDSEYDPVDLRYVQTTLEGGPKGRTALECLTEVYNNSTGCLMKGTFKRNDHA